MPTHTTDNCAQRAEQPLTQRQSEVLAYMRRFRAEQGLPPTITELANHFDCARNNIAGHLKALVQKGAVTHLEGTARGHIPNRGTQKSPG